MGIPLPTGERTLQEGRPLGPAVVYGVVHGACASTVLTAYACVATESFVPGAAIVGAFSSIEVANALSIRLDGARAKRAARFAGGFAAPFFGLTPFLRLDVIGNVGWGSTAVLALAHLVAAGLSLGIAQVSAGPVAPEEGVLRRTLRWGSLFLSTGVTYSLAVAILSRGDPNAAFGTFFLGAGLAIGSPIMAALSVPSSWLERRLRSVLEPEWERTDPLLALERYNAATARSRRASANALGSSDPVLATKAREAALEAAWGALAEARAHAALAEWRGYAALRVAESLVELGRPIDLASLLQEVPESPQRDRIVDMARGPGVA